MAKLTATGEHGRTWGDAVAGRSAAWRQASMRAGQKQHARGQLAKQYQLLDFIVRLGARSREVCVNVYFIYYNWKHR
jgi:hypothetical protein